MCPARSSTAADCVGSPRGSRRSQPLRRRRCIRQAPFGVAGGEADAAEPARQGPHERDSGCARCSPAPPTGASRPHRGSTGASTPRCRRSRPLRCRTGRPGGRSRPRSAARAAPGPVGIGHRADRPRRPVDRQERLRRAPRPIPGTRRSTKRMLLIFAKYSPRSRIGEPVASTMCSANSGPSAVSTRVEREGVRPGDADAGVQCSAGTEELVGESARETETGSIITWSSSATRAAGRGSPPAAAG